MVMKWAKRTLVGLLDLVVLLAAGGAAYQAIASERDQRTFPPPGSMLDVSGYRLHLNVMGENNGNPTVILDSASQSASFEWGWVQPEIAEFAQVVAYDRPGTGCGNYLEDKPLVVVSAGKEDGSFSGGKRTRFTEMHSKVAESISSQAFSEVAYVLLIAAQQAKPS